MNKSETTNAEEMSRSGYEFECSRAELLGIPPPSYEEYLENVENMEIKTDEEQQMTEEPKLEVRIGCSEL